MGDSDWPSLTSLAKGRGQAMIGLAWVQAPPSPGSGSRVGVVATEFPKIKVTFYG
jgi:hypothetical protein